MNVELAKAYEVRVFGPVGQYVTSYRPIGIYAGLSVAGVHKLRRRYENSGKALYTFLNGKSVQV